MAAQGPGEYDLGPLPERLGQEREPSLAWEAAPNTARSRADWREGPWVTGTAGRRVGGPLPLPIRRTVPPAASPGRRAFLVGLVGAVGLAVAGRVSWGAWRGRDWIAFLTGTPFEVRIERRRPIAGRAGPLYVIEGTIRNLSGSPKGFFEVRGRLVGRDGEPLAERVAYAGSILPEREIVRLSRAELDRRLRETVLGEGMANARVEPRAQVPFQIVFVPAPPASRIAEATVEVVAARDLP